VASFGRLLAATAFFVFAAQGLRFNPSRVEKIAAAFFYRPREGLQRKSFLPFCDN
jgi:hypothetical protein